VKLNAQQYQAVHSDRARMLVIAAAGSGKTRVLTERIARLLAAGVHPSAILAITFTNKAANEMLERLKVRLPKAPPWWFGPKRGMTVCTFHSWACKVIRQNPELVNRTSTFTIYDEQDRRDVLLSIAEELGLKVKRPETIWKNETAQRLYGEVLAQSNALDFDGLTQGLLDVLADDTVRTQYWEKWHYVFVDEYQDTSLTQALILDHLFPEHLFVVGDASQSIYAFRGAHIDNILGMARDADFQVIDLPVNYRSGRKIIDAANNVIAHNPDDFTPQEAGRDFDGLVHTGEFDSEQTCAVWVAREIEAKVKAGVPVSDIAILARAWRTLNPIAAGLGAVGVPHKILKQEMDLWDTPEARFVVRLMKLVLNRDDERTIMLVLRSPTWKALFPGAVLDADGIRSARLQAARDGRPFVGHAPPEFQDRMAGLWAGEDQVSATELAAAVCGVFSMKERYTELRLTSRAETVDAVLDAVALWELDAVKTTGCFFAQDFLDWFGGRQVQDAVQDDSDYIPLMTVHAAKGLEFKHVFLVGLEEGRFPSNKEMDPEGIQEARRLMYVAITRAMDGLYVTRCDVLNSFNGQQRLAEASRFLKEMGEKTPHAPDEE